MLTNACQHFKADSLIWVSLPVIAVFSVLQLVCFQMPFEVPSIPFEPAILLTRSFLPLLRISRHSRPLCLIFLFQVDSCSLKFPFSTAPSCSVSCSTTQSLPCRLPLSKLHTTYSCFVFCFFLVCLSVLTL